MMHRAKILSIVFILIFPFKVSAQTVASLIGIWKMHFEMPDGTVMTEQNQEYFINQFVESDRDDKVKLGEAFTEQDSINSYADQSASVKGMLSMRFTLKPNNIVNGSILDGDKVDVKSGTYKYNPTAKTVQFMIKGTNGGNSLKLKKEKNELHLYFDDESFLLLNALGWKVYLIR